MATHAKTNLYRDAPRLGWTVRTLFATAGIGVAFHAWAVWNEINLIYRIRAGEIRIPARAIEIATALEQATQCTFFGSRFVLIAAWVTAFVWIHRMASNAQVLASKPMETTPGWAVGWFFVPVANFYMPYLALKEILRSSSLPGDHSNGPLTVFWILVLACTVLTLPATFLRAQTLRGDQFILWSWVYIVGETSAILICITFTWFTVTLHKKQELLRNETLKDCAPQSA